MTGRDTLIFYGLIAGARGAVPATGNVAPALVVEIYERFRAGDLEGSKAAQNRLSPLRLALTTCTVPAGLKGALRLLGLPIGPCRSPVSDLPPEKEPQMRAALRTAGLLPGIP
jgi:4-hydroxy-tetrahydrodipicolinate synthase